MESYHDYALLNIFKKGIDSLSGDDIKDICDINDFNEKSIYPKNDEEAVVLLFIQFDNYPLSLQDLFVQFIFYSKQHYKTSQQQSQIEYLNIYRKVTPTKQTTNLTDFLKLSQVVKVSAKKAEEIGLSIEQYLRPICFNDEAMNLLLSGKEQDWPRYKELEEEEMQHPAKRPTYHMLTCSFIFGYLASDHFVKNDKVQEKKNSDTTTIGLQNSYLLLFRVYKKMQHNYPNAYSEWRNYILTLMQSESNIYVIKQLENITEDGLTYFLFYFTYIEIYKNELLAMYFDVLYNPLYSEEYRKYMLNILQQKKYAIILPHHDQYCREKNIPLEQRYSLGNTPDIPNKYIEDLSYIDSEKPDNNKEQHFGLSFKSETVKYLFDNIKGAYIDPDTDIRLFCYRLTGKGKPDKISYLKWVADEKSLAFFIRRLGICKNNCWQKTEAFFGNNANNLKMAYYRLTDAKGNIKTDESNIKMLDSIIANALKGI